MAKLTLNVDAKVARSAKLYAKARGTSVSRLVEEYLSRLTKPPGSADPTPVLSLLRGAARGTNGDEHRRHRQRKYR